MNATSVPSPVSSDAAAVGRFDYVAPSDRPAQLRGVKIDRRIDIERCQADVMHTFAFHRDFSPGFIYL
jgi:hypothetical protein